MPRENNFLLGDGERITKIITIKRRSGPKTHHILLTKHAHELQKIL